ncbi:hypothetical protein [Vibrio phage RYC]|nr:hypothetical protein [Vibrio phage RYC]
MSQIPPEDVKIVYVNNESVSVSTEASISISVNVDTQPSVIGVTESTTVSSKSHTLFVHQKYFNTDLSRHTLEFDIEIPEV